ncbi:Protein-glutamate O-methyltransferase [Hondaea fermentalgiana]|uniref:Sugar phosphate phosphatase n=1 Tax=Hondaea fermentalgiana TaxID=2315210 RepID=A0A2R5GYM2_9STRA|nr:Protein-glutamate O-methyltransferase [Hondaea fermentalgiana]|eukprot:GBG33561.1 Protein-glutamate O-methyltransferase [Hondaea fermentalgiana]
MRSQAHVPPLPVPLVGRTNHDFVQKSVTSRLPSILRDLVARHESVKEAPKAKIEALALELEQQRHHIVPLDGSDGGPDWRFYMENRAGMNAMDVEWFFLENYVYRLVLSWLEFFEDEDAPDPFAAQKEDALRHALQSMVSPVDHAKDGTGFRELVLGSLWGNQVDLSFSSGKMTDADAEDREVVVDDIAACWTTIFEPLISDASVEPRIIIILDNCGAELVNDLILVDFLLCLMPGLSVTLHAKAHPVFVSDATIPDVETHIRRMAENEKLEAVGKRLQEAEAGGRVQTFAHDFYTSPLPFWQVPAGLQSMYGDAILTITKGDANYRRLIGDRFWPSSLPFTNFMQYWGPGSLLTVRTCKSPAIIGVSPERLAHGFSSSDWTCNGKNGVVSFRRGDNVLVEGTSAM